MRKQSIPLGNKWEYGGVSKVGWPPAETNRLCAALLPRLRPEHLGQRVLVGVGPAAVGVPRLVEVGDQPDHQGKVGDGDQGRQQDDC
jgi:hypothetical protein